MAIAGLIIGILGLGATIISILYTPDPPVIYVIAAWAFVVFVVVFVINSIVKWFKKDKK